MPSNPYAGYRPQPAPNQQSYAPPDAAASYRAFQQGNPNLFAPRPQVTATFGGQPVAYNAPPLRAGSMFQGGRVMAGLGGGPGMTAPSPGMSAGPMRPLGQGQGGGAASMPATSGQSTNQPATATSGLPAQVQRAFDQANAANRQRYQDLLRNEQADKGELLQGLNGWNAVLGQANTDKAGVMQNMNQGWDSVLGLAGQNGIQSDLERERRRAATEQGANAQSLVNRGLTNTTIADSTRRGVVDDSALRTQGIYDAQKQREITARENMLSQTIPAQMRLNEGTQQIGMNQLQQLIPALMQQNQQRQGIIERRSDEGPNLALYAQALQQQGATQQSNQSIANALQAAQAGSNSQYQGLLNSILGQMPGYGGGGGYGGGARQGGVFGGGFRSPTGGLGGNAAGEQHTGATNASGGGYNSNPGGYQPTGPTSPGGLPMVNGQLMPGGAPMPGGPQFTGRGDLTPEELAQMGLGDMGAPMPGGPQFTGRGDLTPEELAQMGLGDMGALPTNSSSEFWNQFGQQALNGFGTAIGAGLRVSRYGSITD